MATTTMPQPSLMFTSLNLSLGTVFRVIAVLLLATVVFLTICSFENAVTLQPVEAPKPLEVPGDSSISSENNLATKSSKLDVNPEDIFYTPPPGEDAVRRFPSCVIIGFAKCGTRALISYLVKHPYVVTSGPELHFYDKYFEKGYAWYKKQLPPSYSDQITVEKTPAYVTTDRALKELSKNFPDVKLIILVRDPVIRLLSAYAQAASKRTETDKPIPPFTELYLNDQLDGPNLDHPGVSTSRYYDYVVKWFNVFPRKQILVLNGEELIKNPFKLLKRVEAFLDLPELYTQRNFVLNKTSGFYCSRGFGEDATKVHCLNGSKGRKHVTLPPDQMKALYDYYKPHNEKLFKLIGEEFSWSQHD